jgi:hypothetical protein
LEAGEKGFFVFADVKARCAELPGHFRYRGKNEEIRELGSETKQEGVVR